MRRQYRRHLHRTRQSEAAGGPGHEAGGQLSITSEVENFPGFPEGILGPELVENMKKQAERFGAEFMHGAVLEADLSQRPFRLRVEDEWIEARTLDHRVRRIGALGRTPNEQKLIGKGVSSCATCDGFFYRGKKIMVVGGGDSAMEEANFLTRFGSRFRWCIAAIRSARRRSCWIAPAPIRRSSF